MNDVIYEALCNINKQQLQLNKGLNFCKFTNYRTCIEFRKITFLVSSIDIEYLVKNKIKA